MTTTLRTRLVRIVCTALAVAPGLRAAPEPAPAPARPVERSSSGTETPEIRLRSRRFAPPEDRHSALRAVAARPSARAHVIVQFHAAPTEAQEQALARAGVRLLDYLPRNAFLASVPRGLQPAEPALASVRWIGLLEPADRISPLLRGNPEEASGTPVEVDLRLFEDEDAESFARRLRLTGFAVLGVDAAAGSVRVLAQAAERARLAEEDAIRWIGPVPVFTLHNDLTRPVIGASAAQQPPFSLDGAGVQIGVWDESVPVAHPDYAARLTAVDPLGSNAWHATHVAGILAGDGASSVAAGGSAGQWKGVAPGASVLGYQFNPPSSLMSKAKDAIGRGMELSHNSWGLLFDPFSGAAGACGCDCLGSYESLCRDYDALVRGAQGRRVSVVFSAGNDAPRPSACPPAFVRYETLVPVATAKNVITVGAVNSDTLTISLDSSSGPTNDGRLKPDLVAPGCSEDGHHVRSTSTLSTPSDLYQVLCGTSMAAPAVTGAAALVWQQFRQTYAAEPLPSTIKAALIGTATDLSSPAPFTQGPDFASGWGLVNVSSAVSAVAERALLEGTLVNGRFQDFAVTVGEGAGPLTATLVWDDREGAENADVELVNDLDLEVYDPDGTLHHPWTLDPANPASPAVRSGEDHLNPVEQVRVDAPGAGVWTIRIVGTAVPKGPQPWSLVVTPAPPFGPLAPVAPGPSATFAPDAPPAAFSWTPGSLAEFKLQWSASSAFNSTKSSGKAWLDGSPFTPPEETWAKVLKLGVSGGTIWWRITGRDLTGASTLSPATSFELAPAVAAAMTAPADGASFPIAAPPALFSWDPQGNASHRLTFSARADFGKPKKTSGDAWVTGSSWTPSAKLWSQILGLAASGDGQTVYYRIESRDRLGRVTPGPVRTLHVTP